MLTLIVAWKKHRFVSHYLGEFEIYPTLVKMEGFFQDLHLSIIRDKVLDLEIIMTRWFLPFVFWRLKVPDSIKNGIMEFINRYHLEPDMFFDCYSFANMVFGIKQNLCSELLNFWELKPKRRFSRTGELVFITIDGKDYKEFRHAAIYLGFGLYISVYGAGGGLEVSTLKNMKKFFGGDKVFFATPLSN